VVRIKRPQYLRQLLLAALAIGSLTSAAEAAPVADCPLAKQPYSTQSPLLDLMLNPAAKAVVERVSPGMLDKLPPIMSSTTVPSFGAIISLRTLSAMLGMATDSLAPMDRQLAAVPVTAADSAARCARYDHRQPKLPALIKRPALLVFDKITGFRDQPSVDAAKAALKSMAERRGWTLVFSDNGAVFNARDLKRFDAVVWNNISGDVLTVPQRAAMKRYIEAGGGFAAFHGSAGDPDYYWDWYVDTLIGARFKGHPMWPQFQSAKVVVQDTGSAITAGLGSGWDMTEEWYSFKTTPRARGAHVLVTLDESTYQLVGRMQPGMPEADLRMGDHPLAWTQCIGKGRSFYSAIGHRPESYTEAHSAQLLEQGIAWAAGLGSTRCKAGRVVRTGSCGIC
jgi:type 1 glutamine amidotransferase